MIEVNGVYFADTYIVGYDTSDRKEWSIGFDTIHVLKHALAVFHSVASVCRPKLKS